MRKKHGRREKIHDERPTKTAHRQLEADLVRVLRRLRDLDLFEVWKRLMHERDRNRQLAKGLTTQGFLPTLLVDWSFGSEYPCDMVACTPGGRFWMIECKQAEIPSWTSKQSLLGPRSFRERQLPNLLQIAEQGGHASVVLFVSPPRAIDTRAWLLSARGVASMLQQDRVLRLIDFSNPAVDEFELMRLPKGTWGLGEVLLERFRIEGLHNTRREHGWHIPDKSPSIG